MSFSGEIHGTYTLIDDQLSITATLTADTPDPPDPPEPSISKNLVTDYGADPTGATDAAPALNVFHAEYDGETDPVLLTVPAGTYLFDTNVSQFFTRNIVDLEVRGEGDAAWMRVMPAAPWKLGADGLRQDGLHSAKVETVEAGSDTVTLIDGTLIDRFVEGQRCIISGIDLQAQGDPFNNHLFEHARIASIDDQTITFERPLLNGYKSTWPQYNDGTLGHGQGMDQGGAATLYALADYEDCDFTLSNITLVAGTGVGDPLAYICGRYVLLENVNLDWHYGLSPTVSEFCTLINCEINGQMEVDKSIGHLNISGGRIEKLWFQSSSTGLLRITDGATIDYLAQTPRAVEIADATIGRLQMGPGYGVTESVEVKNSTVSAFEIGSPTQPLSNYTCDLGVIKHLIPEQLHLQPLPWAIPGAVIRFVGANGWLANARIIDLYRDETHNYVQTDLEDGWPIGATALGAHPCANWSASDNTGCPEIIEHSMPEAQGKPIYSYSHRTYDHTLPVAGGALVEMWGAVILIEVNVVAPYTGQYSDLKFHLSAFDNWPLSRADGSIYSMPVVIDARTAGARVFRPDVNTGVQLGDRAPVLLPGDRMGRKSHSAPIFTRTSGGAIDISGENAGPVITVEIICDQETST